MYILQRLLDACEKLWFLKYEFRQHPYCHPFDQDMKSISCHILIYSLYIVQLLPVACAILGFLL